ncbi:RE2 [Symbiodinium sp. CCMP2592]|nr:RE2 [Symbiodinium sp. CCMP2592]
MQNPRVCDWLAAETLARYLRATPRFGRVVVLDPASKSTALLNLEVYSDSDWAGCPETRRSTDNIVACLGGAVIQTSCQTQPGLPATSSGDAEIRGVSRAAREAVFLRELAEKDFALACGMPRLWADSAASIGAAKRIGPGSKLRHLEVAEFYVQGALRAKLLELRKVKGTENPANFATKHAKTGPEVRQSLPSMGMVDLDAVAGATEALAQKGTIKSIQASPWKMRPPTKLTSSAIGFLAFLWMLWGLVSWLCRCRRDRQEPEPEDEIERAATEVWLGPEAPQEAQQRGGGQQPRGAQEPEPEGERTPGPPPVAQAPPPPPPAAPRVRRRRRGPEPLSGDDEHLYETARGDKIHLFTNCNGLSSVPPDQILIGFRCHCAADPQNTEFLWTGFAFQVATGRVVRRYHGQQRGCPFMEGATIRHRVCLHCRNGHQSTKPGSAVNNSRLAGSTAGRAFRLPVLCAGRSALPGASHPPTAGCPAGGAFSNPYL